MAAVAQKTIQGMRAEMQQVRAKLTAVEEERDAAVAGRKVTAAALLDAERELSNTEQHCNAAAAKVRRPSVPTRRCTPPLFAVPRALCCTPRTAPRHSSHPPDRHLTTHSRPTGRNARPCRSRRLQM